MRPVPLDGGRIKTYGRVNEPDRLFTKRNPSIVDCCKHSTHHRGGSRGSEDEAEITVDSNDVVGTVMNIKMISKLRKYYWLRTTNPLAERSGKARDVPVEFQMSAG